jgi:hypothetical protein
MTSAASSTEQPPGYYVDAVTGAWLTLPWPGDPGLPFGHPERTALLPPSLGPQVWAWCERWLLHHLTGDSWRFTPGQRRFVYLWYAVSAEGRWLYRSAVKRGAKGPIANDTPVPTPIGWVRHGELAPGTLVYAADGTPTRVLDVHEEVLEPCYEVTFRNGEKVVCTGSHRWPMAEFRGDGRVNRIVSVEEMLAAGVVYERRLTSGRTKATRAGVARWRGLPSPALQGVTCEFPVPPYVLGYWLGDGDSDQPRITAHRDDLESLREQFEAEGMPLGEAKPTHGETFRVRFGARGVAKAALRDAGLLMAKHIPAELQRSSVEQRWALLQGLVDSDGTVSKGGNVEISLSDPRLAADVFELAVGLGLMPTKSVSASSFRGQAYLPRTRIKFTPTAAEIVSRLPRKLERTGQPRRHAVPFSRSRTVVSIERVPSVPARCITVEHESHQYVVGDRSLVTCNTGKDPFGGALVNAELCGPVALAGWEDGRPLGRRHRMPLVQIAANSEAQAKDLLRVANAMQSPELRQELGIDPGETRTTIYGGGRAELLTASEASSEGDPVTAIFLNETHHAKSSNGGHAVAATARRNAGKSPAYIQARLAELTNAHEQGADSVAERSFEAWQAQVSGAFKRVDILYDSHEAPPSTQLDDDDSLMAGLRAAYNDAPWADLERLRDEAQDPRTSTAESIRYYLNGLAAAEDAWIDPGKFDGRARPELVVADREQLAMFLDCSKSTDATGLVAARLSDGHVITLGGWQRPHGDRGKGWLAPRSEVDATVRAAFERWDVAWFGVDPSPARDDETEALYWMQLIDGWHRDFRDRLAVWATSGAGGHSVLFDMRLSQPGGAARVQRFTLAAEQTQLDIDEDETLTHDGHAMLRLHAHNARRRPNQWGVSLGKVTRDSSKLVDLAVCMVGARMGRRLALNSGKTTKKRSGKVW